MIIREKTDYRGFTSTIIDFFLVKSVRSYRRLKTLSEPLRLYLLQLYAMASFELEAHAR